MQPHRDYRGRALRNEKRFRMSQTSSIERSIRVSVLDVPGGRRWALVLARFFGDQLSHPRGAVGFVVKLESTANGTVLKKQTRGHRSANFLG